MFSSYRGFIIRQRFYLSLGVSPSIRGFTFHQGFHLSSFTGFSFRLSPFTKIVSSNKYNLKNYTTSSTNSTSSISNNSDNSISSEKHQTSNPSKFMFLNPHLNYKHFISNSSKISENIKNRNVKDANIELVNSLYTTFCNLTTQINSKRNKRNETTKLIKQTKLEELREKLVEQARILKEEIQKAELELEKVEKEMIQEGLKIPNDTHHEVIVGGEELAKVVKIVGVPLDSTQKGGNIIKDHMTIARELDLIDLESASNVTGTSWYYLRNAGALLELALIQYAIYKVISKGYIPIITPDVVKTEYSDGCGFQPRDGEVSQNYFVITSPIGSVGTGNNQEISFTLTGTAEIPLAGIYSNKVIPSSKLPIRMVGFGRAFRAEAGSRGQDTKGLYRVHQFSKVEMFCLTSPEESEEMLKEIVNIQEEIVKDLGLCFRILDMPTYELGASAYRKYDMEAWMPGRGKWGEVIIILILL
ncbi:seryl-tRNA synthetase [Gigaspora margarita]|uniref:serine--tRNA ligase n=1 Tax=Gigaspora margarita TaxID=4874 RepID=A0A8H4AQN0_GIGMA|nr:seryl-tRNA synthetase [Gigaspora margarita]